MADLLTNIATIMESKSPQDLEDLIAEAEFTAFDEALFDVIGVISLQITQETLEEYPDFFQACIRTLEILSQTCKPGEVILGLLMQVDNDATNFKVVSFLGPLKLALERPGGEKNLDWVISTLKSHTENIELEEISILHRELTNKFLHLLRVEGALSLGLFLLGSPFAFLGDLDVETKVSRVIMESRATGFLDIKVPEEDSLAMAVFYCIVFSDQETWEMLPQVYEPKFVFEKGFCQALRLFQEKSCEHLTKNGLNLLGNLLVRIDDSSLNPELFQKKIFDKILGEITGILVFHQEQDLRKMTLKIFRDYFEKFTPPAKYFLLIRLFETSNHSGLIALVITFCKDSVFRALQKEEGYENFLGPNFKAILSKCCHLPNGKFSDFVEIADETVTALNFLRFLALRDRKNETGFWNLKKFIEEKFLDPIQDGIEFSKKKWIADLEELKNIKRKGATLEGSNNLTLMVGGEKLPQLPLQEKKAFCGKALNALDVIESVLARVKECITDVPTDL